MVWNSYILLGCTLVYGTLSHALDIDTTRYEKLTVLARSNHIADVHEAADGDTSTCIQYVRRNARLWIDLRGLYNVHRVIVRHSGIVSNSDMQLMKNIRIKLSLTTSAKGIKPCYWNLDDIPPDGALDTATNCVLGTSRSVFVIRPTELQLCEVEVYGCVSGMWGAACEKNCGTCTMGDTCDSITGKCPGACQNSWQGDMCDIEMTTTSIATTQTTTKATTQSTTEARKATTDLTTKPPTTKNTTQPTTQKTTQQPTTKQLTTTPIQPITQKTTQQPTTKQLTTTPIQPITEVTTPPQTTAEASLQIIVPTQRTTQPIAQPSSQTTTKPTTEATTQIIIRQSTPPTTQTIAQPNAEATTQATTWTTTQPTTEATTQPTAKSTTQPTTEATTQPTTKATTQPTTEATTQPTTEATTQPTTEATTQPTTEATTQPTTEATTQPTTESTTQVTTEVTTEPTIEPPIQPTTKLVGQSTTGSVPTGQTTENASAVMDITSTDRSFVTNSMVTVPATDTGARSSVISSTSSSVGQNDGSTMSAVAISTKIVTESSTEGHTTRGTANVSTSHLVNVTNGEITTSDQVLEADDDSVADITTQTDTIGVGGGTTLKEEDTFTDIVTTSTRSIVLITGMQSSPSTRTNTDESMEFTGDATDTYDMYTNSSRTHEVDTRTGIIGHDATTESTAQQGVVLVDPDTQGSLSPRCKGLSCTKNHLAMTVGVIMFLLLIVIFVYVMYRYGKCRQRDRQRRIHYIDREANVKGYEVVALPDVAVVDKGIADVKTVQETSNTNNIHSAIVASLSLSSFTPSQTNKIAVEDLREYATLTRDRTLFYNDFMSLPGMDTSQSKVGTRKRNANKNRSSKIVPFDQSRVILKKDGHEGNDYINASYIDSFEQPKAYIATQGPLTDTIEDFWKMIWQENAGKIVMLTKLQEKEKIKCVQYWPNKDERMVVGNMILTTEDEFQFPIDSLRKIQMVDSKTHETREVTQFQFTIWPDHGVPDPFLLTLFHNRVSRHHSVRTGPMVVHCSSGVGRTGMFIALDALSAQGSKTGHVTIHMFVEYMRKCRPYMVRKLDQYMFLHAVLLEYFLSPDSLTEAEDLPEKWKMDKTGTHANLIKEEFEKLQASCPRYGGELYLAAHLNQNISKNSTPVLPVDAFRVRLCEDKEDSDYVNAVNMPTFGKTAGYLVTEMPMSSTAANFWRMIYEQKSNSVVFLHQALDETEKSLLPEAGQQQTFGGVSIRHTDKATGFEEDVPRETYSLTCQDKEIKVAVFYIPRWRTEDPIPPTSVSLISLHQAVQRWQEDTTHGKITVVCRDGTERCGLYCAVCNIIDGIDWYNHVDVFHTVRQLKTRRPEVINDIMQYAYCFDVAVAYTDTTDGTCIKLPDNTIVISPTTTV